MNGWERMALEKQAEIDRLQKKVDRLEEILNKTVTRFRGVLSFIQLVQTASCWKCSGARWYAYDEYHGKPCEVCCPHDQGWWQLPAEGYGDRGGMWACRAGCGEVRTHAGQ